MVKFDWLVLADIHLKMYQDTKYENGIPLKVHEILNVCKDAFDYAVDHKIKNIAIAGDVNHLKGVVHYKPFVMFNDLLSYYEGELEFYIISGNHDEESRSDRSSAIQLLKGKNITTIVNDPLVVGNVTLLPWSNNIHDKIEKLEGNKVLISHFGLSEAHFSSGMSIKTTITTAMLQSFDMVVLGHYHLPQDIEHIIYVGSPIQHDLGEANEEKRFIILDSTSLDYESIITTGYRKYYKFIINNEKDLKEATKEIKILANNPDCRIVVKNKTLLNTSKLVGAEIVDEYVPDAIQRGININMNMRDQAEKYLGIMNIEDKKLYMDVFDEFHNFEVQI